MQATWQWSWPMMGHWFEAVEALVCRGHSCLMKLCQDGAARHIAMALLSWPLHQRTRLGVAYARETAW